MGKSYVLDEMILRDSIITDSDTSDE